MRFQAGIKVFRETGIESFLVDFGLQDVNIIKFHPPSPKGLRRDRHRFSVNSEATNDSWPAET
jgi:hypothetical protein